MPAPRGNKNAAGRRTQSPRLVVSLSLNANLQWKLAGLLTKEGKPVTPEAIQQRARELIYPMLEEIPDPSIVVI